jgi:tellurium resistance protein TerD
LDNAKFKKFCTVHLLLTTIKKNMAVSLAKGQRVSLEKVAPGLTEVFIGLGWDVKSTDTGYDFDLDSSVFILGSNEKLISDNHFIFYNNLTSPDPDKSLQHMGDNLTGAGEGDDEQIVVDLTRLPKEIVKLVFTVNIYDCIARKQEFAQVKNAFVRLVNTSNNQELAKYNLSGSEYKGMTGMIMAEIYNHNKEWKMAAIGNGINVNSLGELVKSYA